MERTDHYGSVLGDQIIYAIRAMSSFDKEQEKRSIIILLCLLLDIPTEESLINPRDQATHKALMRLEARIANSFQPKFSTKSIENLLKHGIKGKSTTHDTLAAFWLFTNKKIT